LALLENSKYLKLKAVIILRITCL